MDTWNFTLFKACIASCTVSSPLGQPNFDEIDAVFAAWLVVE